MALLNIGKKKAEAAKDGEPSSAVPDELPPLPEIAPAVKKDEQKKEAPQDIVEKLIPTKQPVPQKEVPDELPPLDAVGANATPASRDYTVSAPAIPSDPNLFFSQLAQKISNAENLEEIRRVLDDHIIGKLENTYHETSRKHDFAMAQSEIAVHLDPLKQLEAQWAGLKSDIKAKTRQMQQIEDKIKEHTQSLKETIERAVALQRTN